MRLLRITYNLAILAILIIGIIKLIQKEYYLAFIWIIFTPLMMLLPRNLYKLSWVNQRYNKRLLYTIENVILILLFTGASLPLGFRYLNIDIDSYYHLINAILYTILFGILYYVVKNRITKKEISKKEVVVFSFIFSMIFGVILWEKFQYYNDQIFGTKMFFDYFQDANYDSMLDQIFGSFGTLIASLVIYFKFNDWVNKFRR